MSDPSRASAVEKATSTWSPSREKRTTVLPLAFSMMLDESAVTQALLLLPPSVFSA